MFSDEFEVKGRSLADGKDPRWTALNKNDCKSIIDASFIFRLRFLGYPDPLFYVSFYLTSRHPLIAASATSLG